ncbi:MAG: hypothetical protein MUC79_16065 [Thiobacillaceae bacterium]|jgi:hypothetical protein|nr:hypothetical protein [Thiobacillaceae bacterium]
MPRKPATTAAPADTQAAVAVPALPALLRCEVTRHQGAPARRAGLTWEVETPTTLDLHPEQVAIIRRDPTYSLRVLPH